MTKNTSITDLEILAFVEKHQPVSYAEICQHFHKIHPEELHERIKYLCFPYDADPLDGTSADSKRHLRYIQTSDIEEYQIRNWNIIDGARFFISARGYIVLRDLQENSRQNLHQRIIWSVIVPIVTSVLTYLVTSKLPIW